MTGAAGFIGSNVVAELENADLGQIAAVDWFGTGDKWRNLAAHRVEDFVDPADLLPFLRANRAALRAVIHMGAISATTERDVDRLIALNIRASLDLWDFCAAEGVPLVYASSAATYGGREERLVDDNDVGALRAHRPLNAYGWSKKAVDEIFTSRIARGEPAPPRWIGLKFFNVYGPNEYHKGDMRSVAHKLFGAAVQGRSLQLFKSDRVGIADGEQKRDFIYVKDCTRAIRQMLEREFASGIYNLGSGTARSFLDVARSIGRAMKRNIDVEFIEMPTELHGRYQYFTEADMSRAAAAGLDVSFHSLEDGIDDYVNGYLVKDDPYR